MDETLQCTPLIQGVEGLTHCWGFSLEILYKQFARQKTEKTTHPSELESFPSPLLCVKSSFSAR